MPEIRRIEVQCTACKKWSPSPIQIAYTQSFENSTLIGNSFVCPHCGSTVSCNKENMRWTRSDGKGGWVGIDTNSG